MDKIYKLLLSNNEFKLNFKSISPKKKDIDIEKESMDVNTKILIVRFIFIIFLIKL